MKSTPSQPQFAIQCYAHALDLQTRDLSENYRHMNELLPCPNRVAPVPTPMPFPPSQAHRMLLIRGEKSLIHC